jgi:hypothetical protein
MTKPKPTAPAVERLLYDVSETCFSLNIGRTMFYKEVKAGELETIQIGDRQFTTGHLEEPLAADGGI